MILNKLCEIFFYYHLSILRDKGTIMLDTYILCHKKNSNCIDTPNLPTV